jgi:hypothetical protein
VDRLGLQKIICDDILVIHQWHPKVYDIAKEEHMMLFETNAHLYEAIKLETIIRV